MDPRAPSLDEVQRRRGEGTFSQAPYQRRAMNKVSLPASGRLQLRFPNSKANAGQIGQDSGCEMLRSKAAGGQNHLFSERTCGFRWKLVE
eukprot:gene10715-biopygen6217